MAFHNGKQKVIGHDNLPAEVAVMGENPAVSENDTRESKYYKTVPISVSKAPNLADDKERDLIMTVQMKIAVYDRPSKAEQNMRAIVQELTLAGYAPHDVQVAVRKARRVPNKKNS